jgi:hypothetical protein
VQPLDVQTIEQNLSREALVVNDKVASFGEARNNPILASLISAQEETQVTLTDHLRRCSSNDRSPSVRR